jgi:AraC-like DNA-binding protein
MPAFPSAVGVERKTVSPALIDAFVARARHYGLDEVQFLAQAGISESDRQGRLPGDKYLRVLAVVNRLPLQADDLPYSLAQFYPAFPELTAYLCHSPTARAGVMRYVENRCLIGELDQVEVESGTDCLTLAYFNEPGPARRSSCALANFALVLCVLRHLLGAAPLSVRISLQGTLPTRAAALAAALQAEVVFGAQQNRLDCRSPALDDPVPGHQALLSHHLSLPVQRLRNALERRSRWTSRLERMMRALLMSGHSAGQDQVMLALCGRMGVSRWTLQRRLKQEQASFVELWRRARLEEARRLLAETGWPLDVVSSRLGFGSSSAFSRFFRAQCGMAPSQYRKSAACGRLLLR